MSGKSTFLVSDMKYMCQHIPQAGDKHRLVIQKCIKMDYSYYCEIFKLALVEQHFTEDDNNQCINLCPQKCILSQIHIAC